MTVLIPGAATHLRRQHACCDGADARDSEQTLAELIGGKKTSNFFVVCCDLFVKVFKVGMQSLKDRYQSRWKRMFSEDGWKTRRASVPTGKLTPNSSRNPDDEPLPKPPCEIVRVSGEPQVSLSESDENTAPDERTASFVAS